MGTQKRRKAAPTATSGAHAAERPARSLRAPSFLAVDFLLQLLQARGLEIGQLGFELARPLSLNASEFSLVAPRANR